MSPATDMVILTTMSELRSLVDVKAHLSELVARVGSQHERVTVTIAVLSDAAATRALADAEGELARGEGEDEATLAEAMRARRASA